MVKSCSPVYAIDLALARIYLLNEDLLFLLVLQCTDTVPFLCQKAIVLLESTGTELVPYVLV